MERKGACVILRRGCPGRRRGGRTRQGAGFSRPPSTAPFPARCSRRRPSRPAHRREGAAEAELAAGVGACGGTATRAAQVSRRAAVRPPAVTTRQRCGGAVCGWLVWATMLGRGHVLLAIVELESRAAAVRVGRRRRGAAALFGQGLAGHGWVLSSVHGVQALELSRMGEWSACRPANKTDGVSPCDKAI